MKKTIIYVECKYLKDVTYDTQAAPKLGDHIRLNKGLFLITHINNDTYYIVKQEGTT